MSNYSISPRNLAVMRAVRDETMRDLLALATQLHLELFESPTLGQTDRIVLVWNPERTNFISIIQEESGGKQCFRSSAPIKGMSCHKDDQNDDHPYVLETTRGEAA